MRNHNYQEQLSHEQATNEHYIRTQEQRQARRRGLSSGIATTPSASWTDTEPRTEKPIRRIHPLIGRVALTTPDEDLATDYYIGDSYLSQEDMNADGCVVSWAAPAAELFYEGPAAEAAIPDPNSLAARRTFSHSHDDQIEDYEDQLKDGVDCANVFLLPEPSEIPSAPLSETRQAPSTVVHKEAPSTVVPKDRTTVPNDRLGVGGEHRGMTDISPTADRPASDPPQEEFRAERLVRKSLDTPRTGHLPSVLNTLQPDQYRFVTWPADTTLLLQGGPGTGKTVIAAYRALYLIHPEQGRDSQAVALVGPTMAWSYHVKELLRDAKSSNVVCINLEELIWNTTRGAKHALHHPQIKRFQVHWNIYRMASRAIKNLKRKGQLDPDKRGATKQTFEALVTNTSIHRDIVNDSEVSRWLLDIPNYRQAQKRPDCLLLFAAISVALEQVDRGASESFPLGRYDHVIVDEAQDVRGVEWAILNTMIKPGGTWSIIGDMNQRRADHTFGSWKELIDQLEVGDANVDNENVLTAGYRSTRQIMRFADHLIDHNLWKINMLRDGPEVAVESTTTQLLVDKTIDYINHLTDKYSQGTVGIIGMDITAIEVRMIRNGWRRERASSRFHRDQGKSLMLADPIQARGLEFDAAVIVEPADFPTNLGRNGPLYTSLTRAHQELVVVHAKPLPEKLRRGARRSQRKARG